MEGASKAAAIYHLRIDLTLCNSSITNTQQAAQRTVMVSFGKEGRIITLLVIDVVFFLVEIVVGGCT